MFDINNFKFDADKYDIFEGMTSISAVIKSIDTGSSNRKIFAVLYDESNAKQKIREIAFLKKCARSIGFEILSVKYELIDDLVSGNTHGGIIAICSKRVFTSDFAEKLLNTSFYVLIDGIEDPYNFAYSIRSLYAAGVDGILLPKRNWMDYSGIVARSSAGTSELANIFICDPLDAVKFFKDNGFKIVCASIRDSVSLYDYDFSTPVLLIVGGEKRGISRKLLDEADAYVRIDYGRDFMGSLPSASAISVIAFEIARQKSFFKH